jgi:hypothetical protein
LIFAKLEKLDVALHTCNQALRRLRHKGRRILRPTSNEYRKTLVSKTI